MARRSSAKLYALTNARIADGLPRSDVIDLIADLLKRAKRGEIIGVAVGYVEGNDSTFTDWAAGTASQAAMVTAVTCLQFKLMKKLDEQ